jgi:hypothetical protein
MELIGTAQAIGSLIGDIKTLIDYLNNAKEANEEQTKLPKDV